MESKETQILNYLMINVFNPILDSENATSALKQGVRLTISRLKLRNAAEKAI